MSKIEQNISNNHNLLELFSNSKQVKRLKVCQVIFDNKEKYIHNNGGLLDAFFSHYDKSSRYGQPLSDEATDYTPRISTDITFLRGLVENGFDPVKDNLNLYFFKMCLDIKSLTKDEVAYLNKVAYIKNEYGISPIHYVMINMNRFIYHSDVHNVANFIEEIDTNQCLYQDKSLVNLFRKIKIDVIADKAALSIMEKRVGDASVILKEASHERKQVRSI